MGTITQDHFGGNIILKKDPVHEGSSFRAMTEEIYFSSYRYPGGGVTEGQTWENGGLDRMFGDPMELDDPNYVLTIREALEFAHETGSNFTMVIPTFQFYDTSTSTFDYVGFVDYLNELEDALSEYPEVKVNDLEIGNEYWAAITPSDYGKIANIMIPILDDLGNRLADQLPDWEKPGVGIQAGRGWTPKGDDDSAAIAAEIDIDNRELVTTIYQHAYPNANHKNPELAREWSLDAMREYETLEGFRDDLKFSVSEFNVAKLSATGVKQGAVWIEEFGARIEMGVDEYYQWGLNYDWQSNKFYDSRFPPGDSDKGDILTKATPMGQVYDLASSNLIGKTAISDDDAVEGLSVPDGFRVTGFSDAGQRVVFLYNDTEISGEIDLSDLPEGWHISTNHLINADSPYSTWIDESIPEPLGDHEIADARGDMKVLSGEAAPEQITLDPREMLVLVATEPDRDLIIEGAHNETDYRTDMVDDQIYGGTGNDVLRGHVGDDLLSGGDGKDVISAGKGDDTVYGDAGDDIIVAGRGTNELDGGTGDDLFIVTGGRAEDSSSITTGQGNDLVFTAADQNVTITDFEDGDLIGFDGAFEDEAALHEAARADGEDLVVDLPGGGSVRLIGQAERLDGLHNQVVDFSENSGNNAAASSAPGGGNSGHLPAGEAMLDGLNYEQLVDLYNSLGTVDGLSDVTGEGSEYWLGLDETLARTGVTPFTPEPYSRESEEPSIEDPDNEPEVPVVDEEYQEDDDLVIPHIPPVEEDDEPYRDDLEDEQDIDSAAGGACFVATAAFGDRLHPDVVSLRTFRDRHLVRYVLGRRFVRFYWIIGPILARHTTPNDSHAYVARKILSLLALTLRKLGLG